MRPCKENDVQEILKTYGKGFQYLRICWSFFFSYWLHEETWYSVVDALLNQYKQTVNALSSHSQYKKKLLIIQTFILESLQISNGDKKCKKFQEESQYLSTTIIQSIVENVTERKYKLTKKIICLSVFPFQINTKTSEMMFW